jgi:hypothetical protein
MKKTIIVAGILAAAGFLAGCGQTATGTAVISPVATVSNTSAPVTITPEPVTQAPATVTVAPPVTVTQAPSTITQASQAPSSGRTASQVVEASRSAAEAVTGNWIPQLGSYTDSPSAMHRFDDVVAAYPDAIMIWSGDYSSFASGNYYVIMLPRTFSSASAVNSWLDSQGIEANLGFAKFLSHSAGSDGSTVER